MALQLGLDQITELKTTLRLGSAVTSRTLQASLEQAADRTWGNALHLGRVAFSCWFALWHGVASGWVLIVFLEIKAAVTGAVCWFSLCCFPPGTACQLALLSRLHEKILHPEECLSPETPPSCPEHSLLSMGLSCCLSERSCKGGRC